MSEKIIPLEISVIVTQENGQPSIQLRRKVSDMDLIKSIISCAFHNKPFVVVPVFRDKMRSISGLINKGIIYEKDNNYYFTI